MITKRDQNTCHSPFLKELLKRLAGEERAAGRTKGIAGCEIKKFLKRK